MGYGKYRMLVHIGAFALGLLSLSWMLLGLCVSAHYFISPAVAARMGQDLETRDKESALRTLRIVMFLTLHSSLFSLFWYFFGVGVSYLVA